MESLRLRVKDIDFGQNLIVVRQGKGDKDRVTLLPERTKAGLAEQLAKAKQVHQADLAHGYGKVYLPNALEKKYPNANREWGWQYVFPAEKLSTEPRTGNMSIRFACCLLIAVPRRLRVGGLRFLFFVRFSSAVFG